MGRTGSVILTFIELHSAEPGFYTSTDMGGSGRDCTPVEGSEVAAAVLGKPFDWTVWQNANREWRFMSVHPPILNIGRAYLGIGFQADMLAAALRHVTATDYADPDYTS
jgi:hypothetical protein